MPKLFPVLIILSLASKVCLASEADDQANAFTEIYLSTCMKHLSQLDTLRTALKRVPALPPEKAAYFLSDKPGDAWSVPDKRGTFVLALPSDKNFCSVYGRKANTETAKKLFLALITNPPAPLTAKLVREEQKQSPLNGPTQTIAYEWSVPNAARKMMFIFSMAPSESAQVQVWGSASMVSE
jgi:hypothetical protein